MQYKIRLAMKEDVGDILRIYTPYILNSTATFEYEVPSLKEFASRFERITNEFPWLVCETDGKVIGYAYAERAFERAAYQWNADLAVYIDERYQRKGIARKFYECLERFLVLQGYYNVYTAVTGVNDASIQFHHSLGYEKFANFRNSGYKSGRWLDVVWFEKGLGEYRPEPEIPCPFPLLGKSLIQRAMEDAKTVWEA